MDMKNYLRTQITLYEEDKNYPIWRRQERRSKYAVQLASWQLRSNSPKTSVRPERFPGICRRLHGGISLKFYMLMYLDHLQNWLVYGHGLVIFLILALFGLSETGQIWGFRVFPGECMEEMTWNFARWCILTTSTTDKFMIMVWWFV